MPSHIINFSSFSTATNHHSSAKQLGFSLVEMAIVLVIIGFLLGGGMTVLFAQQEARSIQETNNQLENARDALIGFAAANGRLPRPALSAIDGNERAACATEAQCSGLIPWTTLGVNKLDSWGKIIRYSVTRDFAGGTTGAATITFIPVVTVANRKVLTRNGAGATSYLIGQATACTAASQCAPAIIFSHGKNRLGTTDTGVAIPDDTATNVDEDANNVGFADYFQRIMDENTTAAGGEFDDIVIWISPNILFNRMLAAGRLP